MINQVYLIKIESPLPDSVFEYLLSFVGKEKKNRILSQRIKQNADNILVGDILAKVAIKEKFGIGIKNQIFLCSERGKPYLDGYPHIHFNISHCNNYVVCGVSTVPIGIDIQKISSYKPDVAKRICSERELKKIQTSEDKNSEFIKIWTQKESVLKMKGTGITDSEIKYCVENNMVSSCCFNGYWISMSELL